MGDTTTTVEGYVIDIACVRKNPRADLLAKARTHSRECTLMGHCIESGYGIVTEDDRLTVLDPAATRGVVDAVEHSDTEQGIQLRVTREERDGTMETATVTEPRGREMSPGPTDVRP